MTELHSYLGIVIFLILTGCGLPLPEELGIIAAAIASVPYPEDGLNPLLAFPACIVGALAGDCVIFSIGYYFGHNLVKKHPRFAHWLHAEHEERNAKLIAQHGLKVLFVARFMIGVRAPVYLAAGVVRMSFRRFILIDAICATAVVTVFFGLSYFFGGQVVFWIKNGEKALTVLVILAALAVLIFIWLKGKKMMAQLNAEIPSNGGPSANGAPDDQQLNKTKSLAS